MRSIFFSVAFLLLCLSAGAQRFYYIETNNLVDQLLKTRLEKSNQYVVASPIESEYTLRTRIERKDNNRELAVEVILADSLTQKELFRSYEQFCFTGGQQQPELMYSIAIRKFLELRFAEIIRTAGDDHVGIFLRQLRAKKDNI